MRLFGDEIQQVLFWQQATKDLYSSGESVPVWVDALVVEEVFRRNDLFFNSVFPGSEPSVMIQNCNVIEADHDLVCNRKKQLERFTLARDERYGFGVTPLRDGDHWF